MKKLLNKILNFFKKDKKESIKIPFKQIKKDLKDMSKNQLIRHIIEQEIYIMRLKKIKLKAK